MLLFLVIIEEVLHIVIIEIEVIVKIIKIIFDKETIYTIGNSGDSYYDADQSKDRYDTALRLVALFLLLQNSA